MHCQEMILSKNWSKASRVCKIDNPRSWDLLRDQSPKQKGYKRTCLPKLRCFKPDNCVICISLDIF